MKIFVDTGMWFAYLVRNDQYHGAALESMTELQAKGDFLVTSELVISETYTLLMRKLGVKAALKFLAIIKLQVEKGFTGIIWADWAVLQEANKILTKYQDHPVTLTDAASASIVKREGIPVVATFDRHFKLMGLACIP